MEEKNMSSKIVGGSIALLCVLGLPWASVKSDALGGAGAPKEAPAVTRVVVKFRPGTPVNERAALHRANRHVVDRTIPQLDLHAVRIPRGKTAEQVIARYKDHPQVEFAEEDSMSALAIVPNDPWYDDLYPGQWHLPKI